MELATTIYLISLFSKLGGAAGFMAVVIGMLAATAFGVAAIIGQVEDDESAKAFVKQGLKPSVITVVLLILTTAIVPNKNTMYAMLAAYGGQSVIESEAAGRLAPKSLKLLEGYMDKQLKELEEE